MHIEAPSFHSCEFRPLYLPVAATVVLDSVSMSTSVVTGAPVHVVRVVLDGLHLLLTPHPVPSHPLPPGKSGHSVCVLDMEWLELTLKHCNNALLSKDFQQVCPGEEGRTHGCAHGWEVTVWLFCSCFPRCLM